MKLTNEDNIELMKRYPNKYFDLAIVDPPYGGGQNFNFRFGTGDSVYKSEKPNKEYFEELFRVSKNQIIWGGNYFELPINRCWISWFKNNPAPNFSDFELAWTSFDKVSKSIKLDSYGFNHADKKNKEQTIHPTQKPVFLYMELLRRYAKKGDLILDTHLGSGSIAIACDFYGYDLTACEINKDYFDLAIKRINNNINQNKINFNETT